MNFLPRHLRVAGFLLFCLVSLGAPAALADGFPPGTITLTVSAGSPVSLPSQPADFFSPGSDPFPGAGVVLTGLPFTTAPGSSLLFPAAFAMNFLGGSVQVMASPMNVSAVVNHGGATLPGVGGDVTIPIEIVQLSLVSTNPITVTSNGGQTSSFFDVFFTLDPHTISQGSLTIHQDSPNGGTFTAQFTVVPVFIFTPVGGGQPVMFSSGPTTITGTGQVTIVPEPGTLSLLALGLSGLALRRRRA